MRKTKFYSEEFCYEKRINGKSVKVTKKDAEAFKKRMDEVFSSFDKLFESKSEQRKRK